MTNESQKAKAEAAKKAKSEELYKKAVAHAHRWTQLEQARLQAEINRRRELEEKEDTNG